MGNARFGFSEDGEADGWLSLCSLRAQPLLPSPERRSRR